jgi:hypothetical protein
MKELKEVYKTPTWEVGLLNLDTLEENWGNKFSFAIRSWRQNWDNLATFFKYPQEIRTVIYTTNAVETVYCQFRKVTKSRSLFPNDDALKKMLYLAYKDLSKKWTMPIRNGLLFFLIIQRIDCMRSLKTKFHLYNLFYSLLVITNLYIGITLRGMSIVIFFSQITNLSIM